MHGVFSFGWCLRCDRRWSAADRTKRSRPAGGPAWFGIRVEATSVPDGPIRGRERRFFLEKHQETKMLSIPGTAPGAPWPPVGRERTKKTGRFPRWPVLPPPRGEPPPCSPGRRHHAGTGPARGTGELIERNKELSCCTRSPRSSPAAKRPLPNCCRPLSGAALGLPPPGAGVRPHRRRRPGIPERRVRRLGAGAARRPAAGGREHGAISVRAQRGRRSRLRTDFCPRSASCSRPSPAR